MSGYTLSALGSSSASAKAFVTEELSPIQSPSAATKFENSGLGRDQAQAGVGPLPFFLPAPQPDQPVILLKTDHAIDLIFGRKMTNLIVAEAVLWAMKADESHVRVS